MLKKIIAIILLCGFATPVLAARGFGTTYGVGSTDIIKGSATISRGTTYSIAAWFWSGATQSFGNIFAISPATCSANPRVQVSAGSSVSAMNSVDYFSTFATFTWTAPSAGVWHHIVYTYDLSSTANKPTVYIDGTTVTVTTTTTPTGTAGTINQTPVIGNCQSGPDPNYNGKIADVAFWNNTILTANEAKALSKGVSPLKVRRSALSLYYPLTGQQTGEPNWGSATSTQTVTGTAFQQNPRKTAYPFIWTVGQ